jgi:uncharacterized protein YndB with AHSA1/START domain
MTQPLEPPHPHEGRTIRQEIEIRAEPGAVWDAWALPTAIARWFVDRAEGVMEPGATVTWVFDFFGYRLPVEVFAAERGRYLAFGGSGGPGPRALMEVILEPGEPGSGGGTTRVRIANSGFQDGAQWDEHYEGVESGWLAALATLKHSLEEHPGQARRHLLSLRPAAFEYADLQPHFGTGAGLCAWLAESARLAREPLRVGDRVALVLRGGEPLDGRVLARSRREMLLSWEQQRAVLGFKCFAAGGTPGRMLGLDLSTWGPEKAPSAELQARLDGAVERLAALHAGARG